MSSNELRPEKIDPLTAPNWPVNEEKSPLDPYVGASRDERTIHHRTIPTPPDVDQILSGEYTGWIPIIRAGESLSEAQNRAANNASSVPPIKPLAPVASTPTVNPAPVLPPKTTTEVLSGIGPKAKLTQPIQNLKADLFIPDPDLVASPADALEIARQRIAQMRESLQKSMSNVTKSFEHPIFKPENQPINNPPVSHARVSPPVSSPPTVAEPVVEAASVQAPVVEEPVTQYRVQTPTIETELRATPTFAVDESPQQDHSLELVIMRDEIKDLRARLDASQKLIEDLMHRITNLAELALRGRQN